MAAFVPGSSSMIEGALFSAAAVACFVLGLRALLSKVVLGEDLVVHGIWSTRPYGPTEVEGVTEEVLEDRVIAVMRVPAIRTQEEEVLARALMGYALPGRRNRRVTRQSAQMATWLQGRTKVQ